MTQLLLFEATKNQLTPPIAADRTGNQLSNSTAQTASQPKLTQEQPSGVKRMGDLAQAVLVRYEMMARRRELIQQRMAAKEANQNQRSCELSKAK